MMNTIRQQTAVPTADQIRGEIRRVREKRRKLHRGAAAVGCLLVAAAAAVLLSYLVLPVFQIRGRSMQPTLRPGSIVVAVKGANVRPGDVIAFYVGNQLLIKRCIAGPGQMVEIDEEGTVYVDGQPLDEPYLAAKAQGNCEIEFPYTVPPDSWFVLGDNRADSVDSRNTAVGCVENRQIAGKVMVCVWPPSALGALQ